MKATETLSSEHRVIERVLSALETGAWLLSQDASFQVEFFITAADFIQSYADGCHHGKEENILFQAMIENGMPLKGSPVAAMLHEHEVARTYTRGLRAAAERLQAGDQAARLEVVQYARRYANLLRNHIGMEDQIIFPAASQLIPPERQEIVWQDFERADAGTAADLRAKYLEVVDILEKEVAL
jgi:hemerythrin-like domain-containing protein